MSDFAVVQEALGEYLPHSADCSSEWAGLQPECDCHLREVYAALARIEAALQEAHGTAQAMADMDSWIATECGMVLDEATGNYYVPSAHAARTPQEPSA